MDQNYFSSNDLADLFKELAESQKETEGEKRQNTEGPIKNPEIEASRRRYQEIMKKHSQRENG